METVIIWEAHDYHGLQYWGICGRMGLDTAMAIYGDRPAGEFKIVSPGSLADKACSESMRHAHRAMDIADRWEHDLLMQRPRREIDAQADQLQAARAAVQGIIDQFGEVYA